MANDLKSQPSSQDPHNKGNSQMCAHPTPPLLMQNFRSPAALGRFLLTTVIGLGLDLWTKSAAFDILPSLPKATYHFIPGWLHFQTTTNPGAVFGIGQGQRGFFLLVSAAAIIFLTYLFATSHKQRFYQFILGMLLAGVLGNMYDRVVFGHVRDMIYALPGFHWPGTWNISYLNYPGIDRDVGPERYRGVFPWIFNIADVLLCTGVGLLLIYSLFNPRPPHPSQSPSSGTIDK